MKVEFTVTLKPEAVDRLKLNTNTMRVGNDQEVGGSDELWDYLNEQGVQYSDVLLIVNTNETPEDRIVADAVRLLDSQGVLDIILGVDQDTEATDTFFVASVMHGNLVEYQVSNGKPGFRSNSYDTYSYTEAKNIFDRCVDEGYYPNGDKV
jgi:hypothetical protein